MPQMTAAELEAFIAAHFPQVETLPFKIERVEERLVEVRLLYKDVYLRPGGTLSGPSLMSLADTAMYVLILSLIGPVASARLARTVDRISQEPRSGFPA